MIEIILCSILFLGNLVIANEIGKNGLVEITMLKPVNHRAIIALIINVIAFLLINSLRELPGNKLVYLVQENFEPGNLILFGIPFTWIYIKRYIIMPKGKYDYNRAVARTIYWCSFAYKPTKLLEKEGRLLSEFPLAKRTLELYNRVLIALGELSMNRHISVQNMAIIAETYEEMALLYRIMNKFEEASGTLNKAKIYIDYVLEFEPLNIEFLRLKSLILFRQAEVYHTQHIEKEKAKHLYEESLAIETNYGTQEDIKFTKQLLLAL